MSALSLFKAVKARWLAQSLDNTVTGGIRSDRMEEKALMPYCVFELIGSTPIVRTKNSASTGTEYTRASVRFTLYAETAEEVGDLAAVVREAFDWAALSIDVGTFLTCRFTNEIPRQVDHELWSWTLMYDLERTRSETIE